MKPVINAENLRYFACCNGNACVRPVRGIAVEFKGLGNQEMIDGETERGLRFAEQGILYCVPYLNPWAWMNPQAVRQTDEILAVAEEMLGQKDLPVVSTGGSMGGLSALLYARYSARRIAACVANCPVCDLPYHYTERPDLPRTLYSAYGTSDAETLEEALEQASPLHLAQKGDMPRIPYAIFHCCADEAVNKERHSDRLVEQLSRLAPVRYYEVPDRGHCDLPEDMIERYERCVAEATRD